MVQTKTKFAIQSDVKERLKKIRSGYVYDGITTFVRELVQNAFRAKATEIRVRLDGKKFIIEDNGIGCDNPKKLFILDYSGFGIGFGEGFNSIYMVADRFTVETLDWKGELDIQKTLDNPRANAEDLKVDISESNFTNGFRLTLEGQKIEDYQYKIREEVEELCQYIPSIRTYINDCEVFKKKLVDKVERGKYTLDVENRLYSGRIALTNDYYDSGVKVYYEYRFVQELSINGAKGVIELKPKAVNLRAPDRTSIIWDEKRKRLENRLEKEVKSLLKKLVASGIKSEIDDYEKIIGDYLNVKEYIDYLEVDLSLLTTEIESELNQDEELPSWKREQVSAAEFYEKLDKAKEINAIHEQSDDKKNGKTAYQESNESSFNQESSSTKTPREESESQENEPQAEIDEVKMNEVVEENANGFSETEEKAKETDNVRKIQDRAFTSSVRVLPSEIAKKEQMSGITIKDLKKKKNIVWCSKDEEEKYKSYITEFEYNNVYTFLSPHSLYDNALRHIGIPHVSEFDNCIKEDYKVTKTGARSKKEERATELFSEIEELFNLGETFFISDIQCKRRLELNGKKIHQEKVVVNGYEQYGYIHLNRKSLYFGKLSGVNIGKKKLTIKDVKFLIGNVDLISHELAHKIYNTKDNTKDHLEKEEFIRKEILKWIINNS